MMDKEQKIEEKRICPVSKDCPVSKSCTHSKEHLPEIYCDKFCEAEKGIPGIRCITINQPSVIEEMAEIIKHLVYGYMDIEIPVGGKRKCHEVSKELAAIARRGWVRLSADQSLPSIHLSIPIRASIYYLRAQEDMLKAGFRKVVL